MPSVLTGANLANRDLIYLGVSGDGDSASIGFGQFAHSIRRGVNMTYIVENNGVYGLTKGQFSATADRGSKSKKGVTNTDNAIDLVAIALQLGASFVARSFSGDKTQLVPLIAAAIQHKGAAFIDVVSPCVAFNNHAGSTKSFDYVREHNDAVNRLDVITGRDPITVDYAPGTVQVVEQHDGTKLALRKLDADYDPHDRLGAMTFLQKHAAKGQIVTGLLYVDPDSEDLHSHLNTVETPLNQLGEKALCPGSRRAGQDQRQPALTRCRRVGQWRSRAVPTYRRVASGNNDDWSFAYALLTADYAAAATARGFSTIFLQDVVGGIDFDERDVVAPEIGEVLQHAPGVRLVQLGALDDGMAQHQAAIAGKIDVDHFDVGIDELRRRIAAPVRDEYGDSHGRRGSHRP